MYKHLFVTIYLPMIQVFHTFSYLHINTRVETQQYKNFISWLTSLKLSVITDLSLYLWNVLIMFKEDYVRYRICFLFFSSVSQRRVLLTTWNDKRFIYPKIITDCHKIERTISYTYIQINNKIIWKNNDPKWNIRKKLIW